MRATAQPVEGNKVKLSVEVDEEEIGRALDAAFHKMAREVRIPGFRPGKVPRRLLEAKLGTEALRQEALRDSMPGFYLQALRQAEVDAIADPENLDITAGEESGPVSFDATVEVRPEVSILGYAGLAVTVPALGVDQAEVESQIDRLRQQQAELVTVSRPALAGDHLSIDIKGYRGSEILDDLSADDYLYELGSASVVPELDEQLKGARPGDIFKFAAVAGGEQASFSVLVKEVKEKALPSADDVWAADNSEFESLEELRTHLRERLVSIKRAAAQMARRDGALDALLELVETDPPEAMVSAELGRRATDMEHSLGHRGVSLEQYLASTGQSSDELVAELRKASETAVKADLALRALADAESMVVTDEVVEAEIVNIAARRREDPVRLRRRLEADNQIPALRSELRKALALDWLVSHVELVDEEGHPVDAGQLADTEPETDGPDTADQPIPGESPTA